MSADNETPRLGMVVLRSTVIQFMSKILLRGIKFVRTIVLAQLLFPHDFGLFVLASIAMGLVDTFVQSGFQIALVQRDVVDRKHLDGAWTLHVIKGIFLGLVMFFTAPLVALFFKEPLLVDIIHALSFMITIDGFVNMGAVMFQKDFQFGKKLLYDFSYNVTEVLATILVALIIPSVWALVIGALVGRIASVIFSYVFHPYRPRFTLNFEGAHELFQFGKWVWLGGIITFFVSRIDGITIGKLVGTEALGLYQLAWSLALLPALEVVRSLGVVFFPMFARLKNSRIKMQEVFIKTSRIMFVIILPISAGLLVFGAEAVEVFYGERWLPMVLALKILTVYGIMKSIEYMLTPVLLGIGVPRVPTISMIVHGGILAVTIVPLTRWYGIEGAAISLLCAAFTSIIILCVLFYVHVRISIGNFVSILFVPTVATVGMSCCLLALKHFFTMHSFVLLSCSTVIGGVLYGVLVYVCDRISGNHIRSSLLWIRKSI